MKKRLTAALTALTMLIGLFPVCVRAASPSFSDVLPSAWYYSDVLAAVNSGLVNGRTTSNFCPDEYLTYAEAVKLAACMYQSARTGSITLTNGTPWYAPYAEYALRNDIISKSYNWNANASRAGYMEIFAHALPDGMLTAINEIPDGSIPDIPSSHPQADAVYKLYRAGIVQGSDGIHSCNPEQPISRCEVAAILTRMMIPSARLSFTIAGEEEEEYDASLQAAAWSDAELARMLSEPMPAAVDDSLLIFDGLELYASDGNGGILTNTTLGRYLTFGAEGRYTSGDETLDQYVKNLLASITNDGMTREEKLRAAYVYVRDHFKYRRRNLYDPGDTGWEYAEALTMFQKRKGNCYNYAATFVMLARQLGYDAEAVSGLVGVELEAHGWAEIVVNGERCLYDTILEASYLDDGYDYDFYGLPYASAPWPYHKR